MTGKSFDHRKTWLVSHMKQLASVFAVDVCAYAFMSNHYHLVVRVDQARSNAWSDQEVCERWLQVFPGNRPVYETLSRNLRSNAAKKRFDEKVLTWRNRLSDLSWFMRCMNEGIARRANREDECTGRFWEGRFKSQALLDEGALLACMAYVDLNPVRAGLANTLELSDFTSIQERLFRLATRKRKPSPLDKRMLARKQCRHLYEKHQSRKKNALLDLRSSVSDADRALPITRSSYLQLLKYSAESKQTHPARNPQVIPANLQQQLRNIGLSPSVLLEAVWNFHKYYKVAAGSRKALVQYQARRCSQQGGPRNSDKWVRGSPFADRLFAA